ncbi:MAG: peptidoglycan recognition family protein [Eubacteriales bacterium]|nr:peptidoglycan recognition family protein [Eubacteriales bacterium]
MAQKKGTNKFKKNSAKPSYPGKASAGNRPKAVRHRSRTRQRNLHVIIACLGVLLVILIIAAAALKVAQEREQQQREAVIKNSGGGPELWQQEGAPYIDVELLTPNEYSRPQIAIDSVKYIAIHYTANPGATAIANRNYFENLAVTQQTKASSHFVVGLDGEVVQCIPTSEMSYATNERNVDTLSIECCHPDETGLFNDSTYDSVVKLTAWLCTRFGLTEENVIRHYDVTGKNCPKYYVENPDAWTQMKADIAGRIQEDYVLQENL